MSRCSDWSPASWLDTFEELINEEIEQEYGHKWTLNFNYSQTDKITKEEKQKGWKISKLNTFAHFRCKSCSRTWPSARVVVLFRYRLQGKRGTVIMRPFRQSCRQCRDGKFHLPGYKQEGIDIPLLRLFDKIQKNCYGKQGEETSPANHEGNSKPHEKNYCEACKFGTCQEIREK